jgi:hypothetical protein
MSYDRFKSECEERGPACAEFYDSLIDKGSNPGFAAMLALQQPCGTKGTDRTFLENTHGWADRMWPDNAKQLHKIAKRAGISTQGKIYKGGLGGASDPMAWVSDTSDVLAAAKAKGYTVTGAVEYDAPKQRPKRKRLAADIRETYVAKELMRDPGLAEKARKNPKKLQELREKVVEKHSRKVKD